MKAKSWYTYLEKFALSWFISVRFDNRNIHNISSSSYLNSTAWCRQDFRALNRRYLITELRAKVGFQWEVNEMARIYKLQSLQLFRSKYLGLSCKAIAEFAYLCKTFVQHLITHSLVSHSEAVRFTSIIRNNPNLYTISDCSHSHSFLQQE